MCCYPLFGIPCTCIRQWVVLGYYFNSRQFLIHTFSPQSVICKRVIRSLQSLNIYFIYSSRAHFLHFNSLEGQGHALERKTLLHVLSLQNYYATIIKISNNPRYWYHLKCFTFLYSHLKISKSWYILNNLFIRCIEVNRCYMFLGYHPFKDIILCYNHC